MILLGGGMVWYEKFGWRENPFTIDPIPDALVINDIRDRLLEYIKSEMIVNLYGETGAGKSTILNWFRKNLRGKYTPVYIDFSTVADYAPAGTDLKSRQYRGFMERLESEALGSLFDSISKRIFKRPLIERLEEKFKDRTLVLLLDEAGEVKDERISSYIRSLNDNVKCSSVIASVRPISEIESFKESLRTARVSDYIMIRKLNSEEAKTMVRERIERVGGRGVEPFDDETLDRIIVLANYSPREILELASAVLMKVAIDGEVLSPNLVDFVFASRVPKPISSGRQAKVSVQGMVQNIVHGAESSMGHGVGRQASVHGRAEDFGDVRSVGNRGVGALEDIGETGIREGARGLERETQDFERGAKDIGGARGAIKESGIKERGVGEAGVREGARGAVALEGGREGGIREAGAEGGVNAILKDLTINQKKIIYALKDRAKTADELMAELGLSKSTLFTEIHRLSLKRDVQRMRGKGVTKPVVLKTDDKPAKYLLSTEWRLGLVKE
jgi:energy-coupling factor transporter ATP-binding protein EcfA2